MTNTRASTAKAQRGRNEELVQEVRRGGEPRVHGALRGHVQLPGQVQNGGPQSSAAHAPPQVSHPLPGPTSNGTASLPSPITAQWRDFILFSGLKVRRSLSTHSHIGNNHEKLTWGTGECLEPLVSVMTGWEIFPYRRFCPRQPSWPLCSIVGYL